MDPNDPFTRADARKARLSVARLRGPGFRRIFSDVYVDAAIEHSPLVRARAALVHFHASAFVSHATAARLRGVPIPTIADEHVSVADSRLRLRSVGIVPHLCSKPDVTVERGVRISSVGQMFIELSSMLGLVDLVVVGDHLVRKGRTTPSALVAYCRTSPLRNARRALRAARLVRAGVDSPMETRARLLLIFAGLPEPTVNLKIRNELGDIVRRHELAYEAARLLIEYDGRQHVEIVGRWESDIGRREQTDGEGWRTLQLVAADIYLTPERTLQRVFRALRERGMPGLPTRLSDDWRPHFPGRGSAA